MSPRSTARLAAVLAALVAGYSGWQMLLLQRTVRGLCVAQDEHNARKGQRETFFYRVLPVLAAVAGVAAAAGWLR